MEGSEKYSTFNVVRFNDKNIIVTVINKPKKNQIDFIILLFYYSYLLI
jgi:dTDP-glucose pyrophosphorylase